MLATAWLGGEGYEVIPENTADVDDGPTKRSRSDGSGGTDVGGSIRSLCIGSFRSAVWWDKGRGCFGGRLGGDWDETDRIIGGGRGSGESETARPVLSRRDSHCGGPLITPAVTEHNTHNRLTALLPGLPG